jgi:hypothetical protein
LKTKLDLKKFSQQYNNINLIINNNFHDRFIIIDNKVLYHIGTSLKDMGKSIFAINLIEDNEYLEMLLSKVTA